MTAHRDIGESIHAEPDRRLFLVSPGDMLILPWPVGEGAISELHSPAQPEQRGDENPKATHAFLSALPSKQAAAPKASLPLPRPLVWGKDTPSNLSEREPAFPPTSPSTPVDSTEVDTQICTLEGIGVVYVRRS